MVISSSNKLALQFLGVCDRRGLALMKWAYPKCHWSADFSTELRKFQSLVGIRVIITARPREISAPFPRPMIIFLLRSSLVDNFMDSAADLYVYILTFIHFNRLVLIAFRNF